MKRKIVLALSLIMGMLMALFFWRGVSQARSEERSQAWMAYLRGPLDDYTRAVTMAQPLLAKAKLTMRERRSLGEATQAMRSSWTHASEQSAQWKRDAFFEPLLVAVQWHAGAAHLAEDWPRLDLKDRGLLRLTASASTGMHHNLKDRVMAQKALVAASLKLSLEDQKTSDEILARFEALKL